MPTLFHTHSYVVYGVVKGPLELQFHKDKAIAKVVPLHAMKALGGREDIALTQS
jgi:hypothetical protein